VLFNSIEFIAVFLPITLLVYWLAVSAKKTEFAINWLVLASLVFYGWWEPSYLLLIVGSIVVNYLFGLRLISSPTKPLLTLGVGFNLLLLGYYKYAYFFVQNVALLSGNDWSVSAMLLPLAISFFTFQQISYLVDTYQGKVEEHRFSHYCLFVTFFPQLVAGPIVHHAEMLPQFLQRRPIQDNFARGLSIFSIGLFKKIVIADGIARFSTPAFEAAAQGVTLNVADAWVAALSYTFQIYFDFSGYSDMAVGLGLMFGISLPINFNSPYKAASIIDYWRRWHISLSRFLRDYLYIPLGGNRHGSARRYRNLLVTMLLGGLWHGASWTFIVWGALHGMYLVINHSWRYLLSSWSNLGKFDIHVTAFAGRLLTFTAVVISFVYFRAENVGTANQVIASMFGSNGLSLPGSFTAPLLDSNAAWSGVVDSPAALIYLPILLSIVWYAPNSLQLTRYNFGGAQKDTLSGRWYWRQGARWGLIIGFLNTVTLACHMLRDNMTSSEFLYFNF
jgi:alginate O-acetyltransferase complex protein AlgI